MSLPTPISIVKFVLIVIAISILNFASLNNNLAVIIAYLAWNIPPIHHAILRSAKFNPADAIVIPIDASLIPSLAPAIPNGVINSES